MGFIGPLKLSASDLRLFIFASAPLIERSVEFILGDRNESNDEATKGKLGGWLRSLQEQLYSNGDRTVECSNDCKVVKKRKERNCWSFLPDSTWEKWRLVIYLTASRIC